MRVGKVEIQAVSDGIINLDGGTLFGSVPRTVWERSCTPDAQNHIRTAMNSYLIISQGRRILIDTGLGTRLSQRQKGFWGLERDADFLENLRSLSLAPEDIDIVVNTHLHADHCGGNTYHRDTALAPVFQSARYCIQRQEWEAATHPNEWSRFQYDPDNFMPVADAGLLDLLDGDTRLTSEVRCVLAVGHTPGHQCVVVESEGEWGLILGDIAPIVPHLERLHWLTSYDMAPMVNLETKKRLLKEALDRKGLVFLCHDSQVQACRLLEKDGRVKAEPVA